MIDFEVIKTDEGVVIEPSSFHALHFPMGLGKLKPEDITPEMVEIAIMNLAQSKKGYINLSDQTFEAVVKSPDITNPFALELAVSSTMEEAERDIEKAEILENMSFYVKGVRLREIKENWWFKDVAGFESWEEYCSQRWGISLSHSSRLIKVSEVVETLKPITPMFSTMPQTYRQVLPLISLTPPQQIEVWKEAVDTAPDKVAGIPITQKLKVSGRHVQEVIDRLYPETNQELEVLLSHKSIEWYTPSVFIEAARHVMGGIDLDPASSLQAQGVVKAKRYYTIDDDGLNCDWIGTIFLNPPYSKTEGKSNQEIWSRKLGYEYRKGNVTEAILLLKSSLGYNWFEEIWDLYPACFVRKLIRFTSSEGKTGPAKLGSVFFYLGRNAGKFEKIFSRFGRIVLPG